MPLLQCELILHIAYQAIHTVASGMNYIGPHLLHCVQCVIVQFITQTKACKIRILMLVYSEGYNTLQVESLNELFFLELTIKDESCFHH